MKRSLINMPRPYTAPTVFSSVKEVVIALHKFFAVFPFDKFYEACYSDSQFLMQVDFEHALSNASKLTSTINAGVLPSGRLALSRALRIISIVKRMIGQHLK